MNGPPGPGTAPPVRGLLLVTHGARGIAELEDGTRVDCAFRRSVGQPCCGDWLSLQPGPHGEWRVLTLEPRRNVFARGDGRGRRQVIASNLDRVLIVIAPEPAPSQDLVERYLVAVHSLGIQPVLVVNKAELLAGREPTADTPFARLAEYRGLGYPVLEVSCKGPPGIEALRAALREGTSILVGQSGVGKSSLVNGLLPDLELQTKALSHSTGKGRHTTSTTMMYALPAGGRLIDSPGVWEYGLWAMDPQELLAGFPEFAAFVQDCRFNDCRHAGEPGCALERAAAEGTVAGWRYRSYLRLLSQAR